MFVKSSHWSIMKFFFYIAAVAAVLSASASAHATVTTFTSESAWQSAVGAPTTDVDFSSIKGLIISPGHSFPIISGITFTPKNSASGYGLYEKYGVPGSFLSLQNNAFSETIFVSFSQAQSAVGFSMGMSGDARQVNMTLSNGDSFSFLGNSSAPPGRLHEAEPRIRDTDGSLKNSF